MSRSSKFSFDRFSKRQALVAAMIEEKGLEAAPAKRIVPRNQTDSSDPIPLSFAQQRLWLLNQLAPDSPTYNLVIALSLNGPLDITTLEACLNEIVRRHEALRTTFQATGGRPFQVIAPSLLLPLPQIDLSATPVEQRKAEADRIISEAARQTFDLTKGPLIRTLLLRLSESEHVLLLNLHHIVSDAWSMGMLVRELATLYAAYAAGKPSPLPDLTIQYADFALWQREQLQGETLETELGYWKQHLHDLATLELPTDRPRPALQTFKGRRQAIVLPKSVPEALTAFSQREGVTLFMTVLAAYATLLHRYSGQSDIAVGSPIAGRMQSELESLIGFFVNTLVLRADLAGNPSFRELLGRVRQMTLDAYAHQDVPFEKLVEVLRPERDLSRSPLFQVMLVLQNAPTLELDLPELTIRFDEIDTGTSKFDLSLIMEERANGLLISIEYTTDLFEDATITRMLGHFQTLLEGIIADPTRRLSDLPILTAAERKLVLTGYNDTHTPYPLDQPLHALIQAQVARTPDAIAAIYERDSLTYRALDERANQLAHFLRAQGVGPDVRVGICMERSLDLMVALLGVLKAGGAYVPIDPAYPADRLQFMLEDSRVAVLLSQAHLQPTLPPLDPALPIVCLDRDWSEMAALPTDAPVVALDPEHPAYMIYTSGSTGKPKGAVNRHRAIVNRLLWMQDTYQLDASDCVLQKTPMSFDVSVWEFFWPLITGAHLVLARPGGQQDAAYLVGLIQQEQVTTLHFVPSMLQVFLQERDLSRCSSVRRVICSGEALPYELQERFFARMATAELHNLYGPTEAAVDVTVWACERNSAQRLVPIGRPIANTQVYVLDAYMEPVPVGVSGELFLGGVQLARGYLGRPALTAEKFVPDPFNTDPGARLYRTGDLVRWLSDGVIDYLGRIDHQVKLRGFRIELGEIEAVLNAQPQVRESVVLVREDRPGDKRLVAYLVTQDDDSTGALSAELRAALGQKLPEYMVPSIFVVLPALPLSPSGKVERRALPMPDAARPELDHTFVAPATPIEEKLAAIWAGVLGVERVGTHDNFFVLGGHSLLATQVIAEVRDALQVELPLQAIFEQPTIAGFAVTIEKAQQSGAVVATPAIGRVDRSRYRTTLRSQGGN